MTDNRNSLQIHGDNHGDLINYNRYFIHLKTRTAIWMAVVCVLLILTAAAVCAVCVFYLLPERNARSPAPGAPARIERIIREGPRGGKYYLNSRGNKVYVPRDTPVTAVDEMSPAP